MPYDLKRYQESKQTHFITFSCYRRLRLLDEAQWRDTFLRALEQVRRKYRLHVYGYVVMPEHVHVLVSEPEVATLATVIQALKVSLARRAARVFWQHRYYDHNVRSYDSFVTKLRYIHRNPVKRGLAERPEDWRWSSFRHSALAEVGPVE